MKYVEFTIGYLQFRSQHLLFFYRNYSYHLIVTIKPITQLYSIGFRRLFYVKKKHAILISMLLI